MAPYRPFRFHKGGGQIEYDNEGARGTIYGEEVADTNKVVSHSIGRLIRNGEWCHRCDLELPEPIRSGTIESTVLRACREGQMNLADLPWSLIAGRLNEQRCPGCGALMTEKMITAVTHYDEEHPA